MSTCNFPDTIPVADVLEFIKLFREKQLIADKWNSIQLVCCVGGSAAKKLQGSPVSIAEAAEFDQMSIDDLANYIEANAVPDGEVNVTANPLLEFAILKLIELIWEKFFSSIQ